MYLKKIIAAFAALFLVLPLSAQQEKREVRSGNRAFRSKNYNEAEIDYRKGLVKDSTSFISAYDLASSLYMQKDYENAARTLDKVADQLPQSEYASRWYFNKGNIALQQQDYKTAVDAFKQALLLDPEDLQAKESYIYAKEKLKDRQDGQNQQQDGQNQQDNQNQQDDQNKQNDQNQQDDQNQQPQPQPNDDQQPQQDPAGQQISPQQAQQMLKAIQAKEKETQEKVEKAKAQQAQTRRKENNW